MDPMAVDELPEGHCRCCSRREGSYRIARWLGPAYTVYRIVRDHWPW